MVEIREPAYLALLAHALDGQPLEACGLLVGRRAGDGVSVDQFVPTANLARSAKVYEVDPRQHLRAERAAEERGLEVVGVMHSHTHTPAYPSPTDVAQAPDPTWQYLIVSLAGDVPVVRSYRIEGGNIREEGVVVVGE